MLRVFVCVLFLVAACCAMPCNVTYVLPDPATLTAACQSYPPCAESLQAAGMDQALFTFLANGAMASVDLGSEVFEPVLCSSDVETRLLLLYLSWAVEKSRFCGAGEYGTFNSATGAWGCHCLSDHECHLDTQNNVVNTLIAVSLAAGAGIWMWKQLRRKLDEPSS